MANIVNFSDFSPNAIWWRTDAGHVGYSKYFGGNDLKTGNWTFNINPGQTMLGAWDGSAVTPETHAALFFDNPDSPTSGNSPSTTWTVNINGSVTSYNGTGLVLNNYHSSGVNTLTVGIDGLISGNHKGVYIDAATNVTNSGNITGQMAIDFNGFYDGETNLGPRNNANVNSPDYNGTSGSWKPDSNITSATKLSVTNNLGGEITGINAQNNPAGDERVVGINNHSYATLAVTNAGTITGGHDHYVDVDNDGQNDVVDGWGGAAIFSNGIVILNNSATGVIDGNIEADGVGSNITNNGEIDGTIQAYISRSITLDANGYQPTSTDSVVTKPLDANTLYLDVNHNGVWDKGDVLLSKTPDVYTNSGVINGTDNYDYNNAGTANDTTDDYYYRVAFDLGWQNDQVTNTGTINGDIRTGLGDDKLTNNGTIYGHIDMDLGNDTLINTGSISFIDNPQTSGPTVGTSANTLHGGVWLGDGNNTLNNFGSIAGGVGAGIGLDKLTNNASGFIYNGINLGSGGSVVTNNGYIDGGIHTGDDPKNMGQREADVDQVTNSATGVIYGGIDLGRGNNIVSNSGKVFGDIYTFDGNNTVTNNGSVFGDINTGYQQNDATGGYNTIINNKLISGDISTGDAGAATGSGKSLQEETITNNGTINGYICTGSGDRVIVNKGTIHDYIMTGMSGNQGPTIGTDVVINSGDAFKVEFATNNNTLNNSGLIRWGVFMDMSANDAESLNNAAAGIINGGVNFGTGTNRLDNFGHINGDINSGLAQNTFTNESTGFISGAIFAGNGTNTFKNFGTDTGSYFGGSGADTVTNSKDINWILGGAGADTVTNTGHVHGSVVLSGYGMDSNNTYTGALPEGDGNNSLTNSGTIDGKVYGGDHTDTITNTGTISGFLDLAGGGDTVDDTKGLALGDVYFGDGTNTFKGGAIVEHVHFEGGAGDTYTMGAGNDTVFVDSVHGLPNGNGSFSFDGGSGTDTLDFRGLSGSDGVVLDLTKTSNNLSIGGVTGTAVSFEKIIGSANNDFITGTGNADTIDLGGGSNQVIGGGGADKLYAGSGHVADIFEYDALSDSGTTRATRDVIYGFNDNTDKIYLSHNMTLNLPNNVTAQIGALNWDGLNTPLTSHPGETHIHAVQSGNQTIVEIDINGDAKADMSIALDGVHLNLSANDFVILY